MVLCDIREGSSWYVWKRTCLPFPGAVVRQRRSRRDEALEWAMAGSAATVTIEYACLSLWGIALYLVLPRSTL